MHANIYVCLLYFHPCVICLHLICFFPVLKWPIWSVLLCECFAWTNTLFSEFPAHIPNQTSDSVSMFAVFSCFLTEILKNNLLELFFFLLHFYHLIFVHLGAVFRCISFNRVLSNIRGEKSKLFVVNNDSVFLVFFSLVSTGMHKKYV